MFFHIFEIHPRNRLKYPSALYTMLMPIASRFLAVRQNLISTNCTQLLVFNFRPSSWNGNGGLPPMHLLMLQQGRSYEMPVRSVYATVFALMEMYCLPLIVLERGLNGTVHINYYQISFTSYLHDDLSVLYGRARSRRGKRHGLRRLLTSIAPSWSSAWDFVFKSYLLGTGRPTYR